MESISRRSQEVRTFYKYASPETALAVLGSRSFRFSSPLKFNDPFDFQSGLHFDFDIASLSAKVLNRLGELVSAEGDPVVDKEDPWGQMVILARRKFRARGFPRQDLEKFMSPILSSLADEIRRTQQEYQEHWWAKLLPGIRVFCVAEERDSLLMWAHYARDHTGVVFELRSIPEEDNVLSVAEPVLYADHPPQFFTESEWIDEILSLKKLDIDQLFRRYAYIKSSHWAYEKEWRVWFPLVPVPDSLWFDYPIRPSEFSAVYIGCRAEQSFVKKVTELTRCAFPAARLYKASKAEDRYELNYVEF